MLGMARTELEQERSCIIGLNWIASKGLIADVVESALNLFTETKERPAEYANRTQGMIYEFGHQGRGYEDFPESFDVLLPIPEKNLQIGKNWLQVHLSTVLDPVIKLIEAYAEKTAKKDFGGEISFLKRLLTESNNKGLEVNMKLRRRPDKMFTLESIDLLTPSSQE